RCVSLLFKLRALFEFPLTLLTATRTLLLNTFFVNRTMGILTFTSAFCIFHGSPHALKRD
ncbi:MAG: hypothetical protein LBT09_04285, partial [Planctomycetaceae bacterium]|nr:hypothetical protein [Planctomycetaceae bacterium]